MSAMALILAIIAFFRPAVSKADISFLSKRIDELEEKIKKLEGGKQSWAAVKPETETVSALRPNVITAEQQLVQAFEFFPDTAPLSEANITATVPVLRTQTLAEATPEPDLTPTQFKFIEKPALAEEIKETPESKPFFTMPKIDWEMFTGMKLFSWLGGIALFIGMAFLVKYSIENDLIKPWLRILINTLIGFGCIAGSLYIKQEKYKTTADTLAACGIAILYATTFSAQYFYNFISLQTAFVLMSFTSLGGYLMAHCKYSKAVAVLSSISGFIIPFIYNLPYEKQLLVFGFIFILNAGALASAVRNKWDIVVKVCTVGTFLIIAGWFARFFSVEKCVSLITIITVFLAGAAFILIKHKEKFNAETQISIKVFLLSGTFFGAIAFSGYPAFWTGFYLMLLPVAVFKLAKEKIFTAVSAVVMSAVVILAAVSSSVDYRDIISVLILPAALIGWNIFKKDGEHNLRSALNLAGAAALALLVFRAGGGTMPYVLFGALMLLNIFNFAEEEQKEFCPWWTACITFGAQFLWALKSESLGINTLIFVLGAFSVFNFILAKVGQFLKKDVRPYIFSMTLPFLSIFYLYINFNPDTVMVLKCSLFMMLMYGAAVYFTLVMKEDGKFLYVPLGLTLISLLMWNVSHLEPAFTLLASVWAAIAVIIPFLTLVLTRFNEDKKVKDIFIYYILSTMIIPVFMLQKIGGQWSGFSAGFGLTLLINACLLFVLFEDKKNYGKTLLTCLFGTTFMAELVWTGNHYEAYNIFVVLGVFTFFCVLYTVLAFVLRKSEMEENYGPVEFFVLAGMVCVSFMTTAIAQSAQVIYGGFGFLLISSVMLTALIYKRKNHGFYILAMAVITFLFETAWLFNTTIDIYVKAGVLLPFMVFYFVLTLLKGIQENMAKVSASAFLSASILFVISLTKGAFFTSAGLLLFISMGLAYLMYKDKTLHNVQFRIAGALAFIYAVLCLRLRLGNSGTMLILFFVLAVIYGLTDYLHARKNQTKENDTPYIISIAAFYFLFTALVNFNLTFVHQAFAYLAVISALYLWFNHKMNKQTATIAVFAGALMTEALLLSEVLTPRLVYVFLMAVMFMLPAFLSKEKESNILYAVAYISGLAGFVMMYFIVLNYNFIPEAHGLWPALWALVYGAGKYITSKKQENGNIQFLFGAAAFTLMVIAVPMQFSGHWITISWVLEGLLFIVIGLVKSSKTLRLASTGLLMTVVFKLFFIDLWHLGGLYRIAAFVVTAVMLIGVSFLYQKFIRRNNFQI